METQLEICLVARRDCLSEVAFNKMLLLVSAARASCGGRHTSPVHVLLQTVKYLLAPNSKAVQYRLMYWGPRFSNFGKGLQVFFNVNG